jgi:hypothetical protein
MKKLHDVKRKICFASSSCYRGLSTSVQGAIQNDQAPIPDKTFHCYLIAASLLDHCWFIAASP